MIQSNKSVFSFIVSFIQHYPLFICIQLFFAVLIALFDPMRAYFFKLILDTAHQSVLSNSFDSLWYIVGLFCAYQTTLIMLYRAYDYFIPLFIANLKKDVGTLLGKRIIRHSIVFYQRHFMGSVANKVNDVIRAIPVIEQKMVEGFFSYALQFFITLYLASTVNYFFALIFLIWIAVSLIFSCYIFKHGKQYNDAAAKQRSHVVGQIVDSVSNITNIHLFNGQKTETAYLEHALDASFIAERVRDIFLIKVNALQSITFVAVQSFCFYLLTKGVQEHVYSVGDFVFIATLSSGIIGRLWFFNDDLRKFTEEYGSAQQGLDVLMLPFDMHDAPHAQPLKVTQGIITFDNVTFSYVPTAPLFLNTSITIAAGQKVGLVGYSGSGKSTFVNLILRIFNIQNGAIAIDGHSIDQVTQESLHNVIGLIAQEPLLFQRSIMENIRYGNSSASDQDVIEAAKKAHAHDFIMQLEHGYHTLVGERGSMLSGGQRQRIAIARTILKNAPILILDEATSQLDALTEHAIQESLNSMMHEKTTIVIAHRLSTLLHMDRILVFDKGVIVQDGSHAQLIAQEGLYNILWNTQVNGFLNDTHSAT